MMREHEYKPAGADGKRWCVHCGSLQHPRIATTCVERPDPAGTPPRAWRGSALDDNDAMHARLAELAREREAIEAATAPVAVASELDFSCG